MATYISIVASLTASTWEVLRRSISLVKAYIQEKERTETEQERNKQGNTSALEHGWNSIPTRGILPVNKWSQGNPYRGITTDSPTAAVNRLSTTGDPRRMRELLIKIENKEERESTAGMPSDRLITAFKDMQHTHAAHIVAVNRLPSGDLKVHVTREEEREALERNTTWVGKVYKSARVVRKSFPVIVHGISISEFDTNDQLTIKRRIERDNESLHPGLEVVTTRWASNVHKPTANGRKKRYSSLVVHVASPEMADGLIKKYMVENSEMKKVERFDQTAATIRCFNCQKPGHMSRSCPNGVKCAECNQGHDSREHEKIAPTAPKECASCGQKGHTAYDEICLIRAREKQKTA